MTVASGQTLGQGRFEVLSRIGQGGGGLVFEVRDRESDARLALKTVRVHEPDAIVALKREFRAVQDLAHPNLVRLDELFEENGAWFFTMELVEGADWLSYVRPGGRVDAARLRATLLQIVEALSALHARGTMHRDVKPSNVLVSSGGLVKLLDFGTAARAHRLVESSEGVVGTLVYMAPEQLLSEEPTPAADFYSVGVMMYEALTGRWPFFDRARDATEEKLDAPPTSVADVAPDAPAELAALCDALLQTHPGARPDANAIFRIVGANDLAPSGDMATAATVDDFVGRTRELGILEDAYAALARGTASTVVIEGASGVGKSALAHTFLRGLRGKALILDGRCHEREYVPYKGVDAIVDNLAQYLSAEPDAFFETLRHSALRLLPRLFPVLRGVRFFAALGESSAPSAEGDAQELRARIFAAFRELVARVAEKQPLVVAIDDIQWADGDTLALLGSLVASPSPAFLLLCTRRLTEDSSAPEGATNAEAPSLPGVVRRITLGGLSAEEVSTLASRLSGARQLAGAALSAIAEESGGHPLFLQELVRIRSQGNEASANIRLDDALWSRVLLLGERERRIVEAVAIAGAPIALDLVVAAAGIPRRELAQSMAALRAANFVKISGSSVARRVEPYHDRVREAVVAHLDAEARRSWHQRIARSLDASTERDVERLALHWEGAGDAPRAAGLFRESAERASAALAFDRAVDLYRRALALTAATAPNRTELEQALADALFNAGRGGEAGRALVALAGSRSDRAAIQLRSRAANAFIVSGHYVDGIEVLRGVSATVNIWFPEGRLGIVLRLIWYRLLIRIRGLALARRESSQPSPSEIMRVDACWSAAHGFGMTDSMVAAAYHALGARLALRLGDPRRAARALCAYALSVSLAGAKGREHTMEAIERARALGSGLCDPYVDAFVAAAEGFAAYFLEDFATALPHFEKAEASFRDSCLGANYELGTVRTMSGRTLIQLGRLADAERYTGAILRDAVARNDLFSVINTRTTVAALVALARDDVAGAQTELDESAKALSTKGFQLQHAYWLVAACTVDIYRGAPEEALARLDASRAALRKSLLEGIQSVRTMVTHVRARAYLAVGERDRARRKEHAKLAAECATRLAREKLPAATAFAILLHASIRWLDGDRAGATAHARDAVERFRERGMALYLAAARQVLAHAVGEGEEARSLESLARAALDEQRIAAPARFVALYAPGFAQAVEGGEATADVQLATREQ